jgi:PEP-CTERM motif
MVRKTCVVVAGLALLAARSASATTIIDLTTAGATSTQNAAIGGLFTVTQISPQSTGTGVIDPFLRIQQTGQERGYNTDVQNPPLDDKAGTWTSSLLLSELPVVSLGGIDYYQFLLDINQTSANSLLSLNQIQIFQSPSDPGGTFTLTEATAGTDALISFAGATEVFRMDNLANNYEIKLDYSLNPGSGAGDMFLYVKKSDFSAAFGDYVILFSQFGAPPGSWSSNDGFEEWAVLKSTGSGSSNPQDAVPEPASLLLLGSGLALAARRVRRKKNS